MNTIRRMNLGRMIDLRTHFSFTTFCAVSESHGILSEIMYGSTPLVTHSCRQYCLS